MAVQLVDTYQFTNYSEGYRFPHYLANRNIIFEASSVEGQNFNWLRAGRLIEIIEPLAGFESHGWKRNVNFERVAMKLEPTFLPYQLYFVPVRWLRDALIKVWTFDDLELDSTPWTLINISPEYQIADPPFQAPSYQKDILGVVSLRGSVVYVGGTVGVILTLPEGFRPQALARFICSSVDIDGQVSTAWVQLSPNGELSYIGGPAYGLTFDQINFSVD